MEFKYCLFRIHTNFKTLKNVKGWMEKKTPNFLTYLFGVTPPIRCYPLLRYMVYVHIENFTARKTNTYLEN